MIFTNKNIVAYFALFAAMAVSDATVRIKTYQSFPSLQPTPTPTSTFVTKLTECFYYTRNVI